MSSLSTKQMKVLAATEFLNSVANNSLYFMLGKQTSWANSDTTVTTPTESVQDLKDVWDNMFAGKILTGGNVSLVIRRIDWSANTTFNEYDDQDQNLDTRNFYIINSNNEIYKCLSNNNGSLTSDEPIDLGDSSNNYIQTTSDGYKWKYMFNVAIDDNFINSSWIPVKSIGTQGTNQYIIQNAAIDGSIDIIKVIDGGSNYTDNSQSMIITIKGDGFGASAYANVNGNSVKNIELTDFGQGYTYACANVATSNGTNATARVVLSPKYGHGSNPVTELFANTVMVSLELSGEESGYFTTNNSFRQTTLNLNPKNYDSSNVATNTRVSLYTEIYITSGIGTYIENETVYQGVPNPYYDFEGKIIDFDPINNKLRLNAVKGSANIGNILFGANSGAQRSILSINQPNLEPYSGQFVYISNNEPIERSTIQTENFKFIIRF